MVSLHDILLGGIRKTYDSIVAFLAQGKALHPGRRAGLAGLGSFGFGFIEGLYEAEKNGGREKDGEEMGIGPHGTLTLGEYWQSSNKGEGLQDTDWGVL